MSKRIDLEGKRFGKWTVIKRAPNTPRGQTCWECQCQCSKVVTVIGNSLRQGKSTNCGCLRLDDLTGRRFSRLTVLRLGDTGINGEIYWICSCDCDPSKESIVRAGALRNGTSKSCGYYQKDMSRVRATTHGLTGTPEFMMWNSIKSRAKRTKVSFTLELSDIKIPEICPLLGIKLEKTTKSRSSSGGSPSLDRIVPFLGYVPDNVQVISNRANMAKSNLSFEEFEKIYLNWKAMRDRVKA